MAGLPVAVNMVWLLAHTTVRGRVNDSIELPVPAPKRRRADVTVQPWARPLIRV
jgi:hypothetical protein